VGFAARWDQEKQPDFYMDLIELWAERHPGEKLEFALFSGAKLKSNNDSYMARTRDLQARGLLTIYEDLEKNDYYSLLNDTRVLFNCALQDWVSNTVSEADTLGVNVLYPAYRSFPESFGNDARPVIHSLESRGCYYQVGKADPQATQPRTHQQLDQWHS
jgi:hypothetical protein